MTARRPAQPASLTALHPSPLEAHLGFWLRFVSNHVSARFRSQVEARGVSVTEWVALRTLYDHRHATHAVLIDALGMTKGAASKVVTRLEAKGLARREHAPGSARGQVIALTEAGRALVPELAADADANEAHFFAHLPSSERVALLRAFRALAAHHALTEIPVV